jgi:uncharacterized phage protein (TIGR02218 family)
MKSISTRLLAHLGQDTTTVALLWKLTRTDSTVLGFTDHDTIIVYNDGSGAVTYYPQQGATGSASDTASDMSASNQELVGFLESDSITEADIFGGKYDYAVIEIRLVNYNDLTMGALLWKRATLGEVKIKNGQFTAELRGLEFYLSTLVGETYGPTCRADLGDSRCTIDVAALSQNGSVATPNATYPKIKFVPTAGLTGGSGYFNQGVLTWLTGANAGYVMEVGSWDGTTIVLFEDMPNAVQAGDTFAIEPGCDKLITTCHTKFSNVINFRGENAIPGMDQIMIYPNANGSLPG